MNAAAVVKKLTSCEDDFAPPTQIWLSSFKFCLPLKTSYHPAENVSETPDTGWQTWSDSHC